MRETHRRRYRLILLQPIITISSNIHEFLVQIFYNSQKNVTGVQDVDIGLYEAVKTAGKHFRAGSEMTWSQRFRRLHTAWFAVSQLQHPATHVCGLEFRHLSVVFPLSIDSTVIKPRMVFKQSGQLNEGVLQLLDSFRERGGTFVTRCQVYNCTGRSDYLYRLFIIKCSSLNNSFFKTSQPNFASIYAPLLQKFGPPCVFPSLFVCFIFCSNAHVSKGTVKTLIAKECIYK